MMLLSSHGKRCGRIVLDRLIQFLLRLVFSPVALGSSRSCTFASFFTADIVVKIVIVACINDIADVITIYRALFTPPCIRVFARVIIRLTL